MSAEGNDFSLTVLGSDGSYPGPGGACSGYLLHADGFSIWMDAGSGTLANLQRHIALGDLGGVVLSHSHPDHWSDIQGLYVAMRYFLGRRDVPVYSPAGIAELVHDPQDPTFVWNTIKDGMKARIGSFHWTWSQTDHPVETLGARVESQGRVLAYSADTGPGWPLSRLGPGVDLALVEASTTSDQAGSSIHLSAHQAGESAAEAHAERLVITHLTPQADREKAKAEASGGFGREVEVAAVGRTWLV